MTETELRKQGCTRIPLTGVLLVFVEGHGDLIAWLDDAGFVRYCYPGGMDENEDPMWEIVSSSNVTHAQRMAARRTLEDAMADRPNKDYPQIAGEADY